MLTGIFIGFVPDTQEVEGQEFCSSHIGQNLRRTAHQRKLYVRHVLTDRSNKRNTSYLALTAFNFFSKKIRIREQTPTLKDTLNFPVVREETPSKKNDFQRLFNLSSAKLFEVTNDVWSVSGEFRCRHLTLPSRSAVRAQ